MKTKKEAEKPTTRKAKVSVAIFLLAVVFIVALLLFKPYIGHTLGSRDIIIISMLMAGLVIYWFCDISLDKIKNTPIFGGWNGKLGCGSRYRLDELDHHRRTHSRN